MFTYSSSYHRKHSAAGRLLIFGLLRVLPYPIRQVILGVAFALSPKRVSQIVPVLYVTFRDVLFSKRSFLPNPDLAFNNASGLCGLARNPNVEGLIAGYEQGMYVFSHIGPLKWWSPPNRAVLFFNKARIEKTTRRLMRSDRLKVTFDAAFSQVVLECAKPRDGHLPLTWITPNVHALFCRAFAKGHAHSVEVWSGDQLVGGLFGLSVGRVFFTESQFHTVRDASKVAFAVLNRHLQSWGYALNDGKELTPYLIDAGVLEITRAELRGILQSQSKLSPNVDVWALNPTLLTSAWEPESSPGQKMEELLPNTTATLLARKAPKAE